MKLFEPGNIGRLTLKNRIVMAAMGVGALQEPDGRLSQRGIRYYTTRAEGGVGMITTCLTRVSRQLEQPKNLPWCLLCYADGTPYIGWLSELTNALHDYGCRLSLQLTAGHGRVASPKFRSGGMNIPAVQAIGPSSVPCFWTPGEMTRELTLEEIEQLVQDFRFAAQIAGSAGVDAIELHGHEGYLFDQFSTALWNKRLDRYGGSIEARMQFALQVIEGIKKAAGSDFPVIYQFAITHYLEGGREIEESLKMAKILEEAGVDALHVDAGCYETWYWPHPPTYQPPGCMINMAEAVKKVVKIPVITVGKLGYPELAEKVLLEDKADFIALGRPLLADPNWPNKVKEGKYDDIRHCVGDHVCFERVLGRKYVSCTVNPACGMEEELALKPAERHKSVLVVGGGPAGMEAAKIATLRGHKVTLWEKENRLGGNLIPASVPDFKQDYRNFLHYLSRQIEKLGVKIEFGKEATLQLIEEENPDVVFIATGGKPIIPQIPGIGLDKVVTAASLLLGKKGVGDKVVVIGGGLLGGEVALYLAQKSKTVTIVEILQEILSEVFLANRMHLEKLLGEAGVRVLTESNVFRITEEGVIVHDKYGNKEVIRADTVVIACGYEPDTALLESVVSGTPEVYGIGDSVECGKLVGAVWKAYRTARLV